MKSSVGAILRLKLRCFQTEKRQVVLYETVVLTPEAYGGRGGQIDPPLDFFGFKFLLLDRLS